MISFPRGITDSFDILVFSINNRGMTLHEFETAKKKIEPQRRNLKNLKWGEARYEKRLQKYMETLIALKGHAWCMDAKIERHKMAKLIGSAIVELYQ